MVILLRPCSPTAEFLPGGVSMNFRLDHFLVDWNSMFSGAVMGFGAFLILGQRGVKFFLMRCEGAHIPQLMMLPLV